MQGRSQGGGNPKIFEPQRASPSQKALPLSFSPDRVSSLCKVTEFLPPPFATGSAMGKPSEKKPGGCVVCDDAVKAGWGDGDDGILCHCCSKPIHYVCFGLSKPSQPVRKALSNPGVNITCNKCQLSPKPPASADSPQVIQMQAKIENLSDKVDQIASFLSPPAQPQQPSYASIVSKQDKASSHPSFLAALKSAVKSSSDEDLHSRTVVFAGIAHQEGEDLSQKISTLLDHMELTDFCRFDECPYRLPRPKNIAPSDTSPPLCKVEFKTRAMAQVVVQCGKKLKTFSDGASSSVFVRPSRTTEQRQLLRLRFQRREFLLSKARDSGDPGVDYFVDHRKQDFPLIPVRQGEKPDWNWTDDSFLTWAASTATDSRKRAQPSSLRPSTSHQGFPPHN